MLGEDFYNMHLRNLGDDYVDLTTLWHFTLTNRGEVPLKNVKIVIPKNGHYAVVSPKTKTVLARSETKDLPIPVGPLDQRKTIEVWLWTTEFGDVDNARILQMEEKEEFSVTHEDGEFPIIFPISTQNAFYKWLITIEVAGILFGIALAILFYLLRMSLIGSIQVDKPLDKPGDTEIK